MYIWIPTLLLLSFISLFVGVSDVKPWHLLSMTEYQKEIMIISRIPRLLSILLAGAGMSVIGLIMQQLTRNRFVSPTTAGTTDSAALGVLITMLLLPGAPLLAKISVAFVFALAGTLLFMYILSRISYKDPVLIALVGLMFGGIVGSASTFIALKYNLLQSVTSWLHGDFSAILMGRYEMLYLTVPLVALAYGFADRFTIAGMGEHFAVNLGLNYRQSVFVGLAIVSLVAAVILLTVGALPFLGLVVPNIVALYYGDRLRSNLPRTAALGAVFVLACDIAGRLVIYPYEISIGLMVGVVGGAVFLYLLLRRHAYARS